MSMMSLLAEKERQQFTQPSQRFDDPDEENRPPGNQLALGSTPLGPNFGSTAMYTPLGSSNRTDYVQTEEHASGHSQDFPRYTLPALGTGPETPDPSLESILGRRSRTESSPGAISEWSRHNKVLLKEFAGEIAGEYGVAADKLDEFLDASTLPTHKLLIVTLAAVIGGKEESSLDMLQAFLLCPAFKEHVTGKLRSILLDPKLSSYKMDFWTAFSAHITSRSFRTAVSGECTAARSELKRKMSDHANKGSDIAVLGKALVWEHTQEMTDEFWGRFAWLNDVRNFWDTVDEKLAERREEMLGYPAEERDKRTSFLFECSLREHIKKFPIKKGGKRKPGKQIPAWQAAISRAVDEMEGYTMEDLAGEEEPEEGPGPDDDDNT
ncbi:hypothetical protein DFH09DRAFT_1091739 [Mycena vulgaris]|nr:hypothetical protein DFH09DRAFT_1091739 [Mycena vulgaris]